MKSIMVVDDNKDINFLISRNFRKRGYNVISAFNGKQALEVIIENRSILDVLILDMMMPVLSGSDVLNRLNELDIKIPVFILSAAVSDTFFKMGESSSVFGVFRKTDDIETLVLNMEKHFYKTDNVVNLVTIYEKENIDYNLTVLKENDDVLQLFCNHELSTDALLKFRRLKEELYLVVEQVDLVHNGCLVKARKLAG